MKMNKIYPTNQGLKNALTSGLQLRLWAVLSLIVLAGFLNQAFAQVSVTATAGTLGPTAYTTLKGAFDAINAGTHQGAITIGISANTTETAPAVLNSSGAGSAIYTSVLVQPTADGVTVSGATVTGRGLIELNGADNVTINGDNPNTGGINRNLTITNTAANTVTFTSVIRIALATTIVTSADNNTIKNLNLNGSATGRNISGASSTTGTENTTFGIVATSGASTVAATTAPSALASVSATIGTGATATNLTIDNNNIQTVARAIAVMGSSTTVFPGTQITGNLIGNSTIAAVNQVYSVGITAQGSANGVISGNTVYLEGFVASSSSSANRAIDVGGISAIGTYTIERNMVNRVTGNAPDFWLAHGINLGGGNGHIVRNNFVSNVTLNTTSGGFTSTTFCAAGIRIASGLNHQIYHNTVNMNGVIPGATQTITAALMITASTLTGIDVRNNIFVNSQTGAGLSPIFVAVWLPSGATSSMNLTLNNNDYFNGAAPTASQGIGQAGTTAGTNFFTQANFNAAVTTPATNFRSYTSTLSASGSNDNASTVTSPPLTSSTDLHIVAASVTPLESGGAVVGVTTDIDGQSRPSGGTATFPDIGADEFAGTNPNPCVATPVPVTVTPTSANYCTGNTPITLTASGADTYSWAPASGLSATTGAIVTASPTSTTTYIVTGTRTSDGCVGSASTSITVLQSPVIAASASPATVACLGTSQLQVNIQPTTAPNTYTFAGSTGTYTAISGTSAGASAIGDDVGVGNLPIGFTFYYNGVGQTVFAVSSNGLILLGNTSPTITGFSTNALSTNANAIAPLWEDNNTTGGVVEYLTTGSVGNRILTVQWTNMHVGGTGSGSNPTISLQLLLYEATGQIQFIYGSTSAAFTSTTASIGISGNVGNFLSVTPLSPANTSTVSSVTENSSISSATNFPSGTIYTFSPPPSALPISWSPSTFLNATNISNPVASNVTSTTIYTVSVTGSNSCVSTATATVTVSPACAICATAPAVFNNSGSVCSGGGTDGFGAWQTNRAAAVSGATGAIGTVNTLEYSTTVPSSGSPATGAGNITGTIPAGCAAVNQVVTAYIRCDNGTAGNAADDTWTAIGTFTLTVYPAVQTPNIVTSGCSVTITGACPGDVVTLSGATAVGSVTGNGTNSATFIADPGASAGTINYSVATGVSGSTCTALTGSTATPVCPLGCVPPVVSAPTVSQPVCGQTTGSIVVNATGSSTLEYSVNGGGAWQTSATFPSLAPGNYNIVVRIQAMPSCSTAYAGNPVVINPAPAVPTAFNVTGGGAYCAGGTGVAIGLSGSQTGVTYQLKMGVTNVGAAVPGTGAALNFGNQTTAGTYTVVATNSTSACTLTMTGSATVTINPLPTAFNVTGGGAFCAGGTGVEVGLSGSQTGVNYQLQLNNVNTGPIVPGTGSALSFGNQTSAGTYTVVATNATTTCAASMTGSATVTVNPLPTAFNVTGGGTVCTTDNIGVVIGLSGSQTGVNYQLKLGAANVGAAVAGTGNAISFPGQLTVGTYTVVATNATTSCSATMSGNAVINAITCTPSISDPCSCLNNATTLTNGQFGEVITVNAPAGQTWTVTAVSGLYTSTSPNPPATPTAITVGTVLTPSGMTYTLSGRHIDAIGYTITVANGAGTSLAIGNTCAYPNPVITSDLTGPFCLGSEVVTLAGNPGDALLGTPAPFFTVNGNTTTTFDPSAWPRRPRCWR